MSPKDVRWAMPVIHIMVAKEGGTIRAGDVLLSARNWAEPEPSFQHVRSFGL